MKKRLLSTVLAVCLLLSLVPIGAGAIESGTCGKNGDNLTWTLDNNILTISGTGAMADYPHEDPPWYQFANFLNPTVTTVLIEDGVTSIGISAFDNCTSITRIQLPDTVTSIGEYAFISCENLSSVNIPSSVTLIGHSAFCDCSSLETISIPEGVTTIEKYTFRNCTNLSNVTIPTSVTSIGSNVFERCTSLSGITIPPSVISIGSHAFAGCSELSSITIPEGITGIEQYTFAGCLNLTSISLPKSLGQIDQYAFGNCTELSDVYYAGTNTEWNSITIDSLGNPPLTDGNATIHCSIASGTCGDNLTWVLYEDGTLVISGTGEMTFSGSRSTDIPWYQHRDSIKTVNIENGATNIQAIAFTDCQNLTSVSLPNSLTSIGSRAFWECQALTDLTIPDSITNIGTEVFVACTSLASVTLPNGLTNIPDGCFKSCSQLSNLTIPGTVTSIGNEAFFGCLSLTSITIPDSVTSIGLNTFFNCCGLTSITLPRYLTAIGASAFYGCTGLTSITIPDSVTSFGNCVFWECTGLTSVTLPRNLTSIPEGLFDNCTNLASVTIPNCVTSIGGAAFRNCRSLSDITLPGNVTSIGYAAFENCGRLSSINIPSGITEIPPRCFYGCSSLTEIELPDCVTGIGQEAFEQCSELSSIIIPDEQTHIWDGTFWSCHALTSITIPDGVIDIGVRAFSNCSSMSSITIPNSVTEIKDYAFYKSNNLTDVYYDGTESQWNAITIGNYNDPLLAARIHFANTFSFTAVVSADHFNVGDTVTVDIMAVADQADTAFSTFQFQLAQPSVSSGTAVLTLQSITTPLTGGTAAYNGPTMAYNVNSGSGISIDSDGIVIATATYQVTSATEGAAVRFGFAEGTQEMTAIGYNVSSDVITEDDTATLHNLTVTLNSDEHGTVDGTNATRTLYAKYNVAGLYTNEMRTTEASITPSAADTYRLADNHWISGGTQYKDFAAIAALTPTESATYTLQTVKQYTITIDAAEHASTTNPITSITVDTGTLYKNAGLPAYSADANYTAVGWYNASNTPINMNAAITDNVTIHFVASPSTFTISQTAGNDAVATLTYTGGVTGSNTVTYGTDVTVTVAPVGSKLIQSVTYTVGEGAAAQTAVPVEGQDGKYTIPGSNITGNVVVEVTTTDYVTVTFQAAGGASLSGSTIAYAYKDNATLYASKSNTALSGSFTLPTAAASSGYRLKADTAEEPLWSDGTNSYQSSAIGNSTTFSADITLTAQTVKTWTVTFTSGENGSLEGTTSITVDENYVLAASDIPTPTGNAGYTFKEWQLNGAGTTPVETTVTGPVTYTAIFENGTYDVTLPTGIANAVFTGNTTATHGADYQFTMSLAAGIRVTKVSYRIGDSDSVPLDTTPRTPADGVQTYTIPGASITGPISITIESNATYVVTVTFDSSKGTVSPASRTYNAGDPISAADFTITPNAGYDYSWAAEPNGTVTGAATYTVNFTDGSYSITVPENGSAGDNTASHGKDYTFTPTAEGKVVYDVSAYIGDTSVTVFNNGDGTYTIPGESITGNITLTYTTLDGSWSFISYDKYMALESGSNTQIAVLITTRADKAYALTGYADMLWSAKYNGYVYIVAANETEAILAAKLSASANDTQNVDYSGNVNGDDRGVTAADSAPINDALHNVATQYTISVPMRLALDVNGDQKVTTQDILWVLDEAVGNHT